MSIIYLALRYFTEKCDPGKQMKIKSHLLVICTLYSELLLCKVKSNGNLVSNLPFDKIVFKSGSRRLVWTEMKDLTRLLSSDTCDKLILRIWHLPLSTNKALRDIWKWQFVRYTLRMEAKIAKSLQNPCFLQIF